MKILNSDDVFTIMQEILLRENKIGRAKKHFWVIGLADNNKVLFIELISTGSVKATAIEPMDVFRVAVLKNAARVILVHNRPSGKLKPSTADREATDRLIQVGRIIRVEVIDHLIISPQSFVSFVDTGLLKELQRSMKWMPPQTIVEQIKGEERKIRKEHVRFSEETGEAKGIKKAKEEGRGEGLKEGRIEIAKLMKQDNRPEAEIQKYTRLSLDDIQKL